MSLTIEVYSVEPQAIVTLFSENLASVEDFVLFEKLKTFPMADFPGRLLLPDDMDSLCGILANYRPLLPVRFQSMCVKELWDDGFGTESLTLLSDLFVSELATFTQIEIQQAALEWAGIFSSQQALHQSPAYCAVLKLQEVAHNAMVCKKSLVFYLAGAPGFFEYLRHL